MADDQKSASELRRYHDNGWVCSHDCLAYIRYFFLPLPLAKRTCFQANYIFLSTFHCCCLLLLLLNPAAHENDLVRTLLLTMLRQHTCSKIRAARACVCASFADWTLHLCNICLLSFVSSCWLIFVSFLLIYLFFKYFNLQWYSRLAMHCITAESTQRHSSESNKLVDWRFARQRQRKWWRFSCSFSSRSSFRIWCWSYNIFQHFQLVVLTVQRGEHCICCVYGFCNKYK